MRSLMLLLGLSFLLSQPLSADVSVPNETPEQFDRRAQWFRDAKIGVFIHWNPSVIIEREISWCRNEYGREKYDELYKRFNPPNFNAKEWIRIFHDAGIRYAVFVPKHHDGFAMFRTKTYDYNVLNTPWGRDFTKEVAEACHKGGVRFCLYYSVLDWWNPDYKSARGFDLTNYVEKTFKPHIEELLTQYGPVGAIWFDGNWEASWTREHALNVGKLIRKLQPDLLIGNRLEPKARKPGPEVSNTGEPGVAINGDLPFVSSFYDAPDAIGDYQAREMMFGHYYDKKAWDSCYNFAPTPAAPNGAWSWLAGAKPRPLSEIVNWIVQCIGRDGNALLGIGPKPDGTIDAASAVRLKELGVWVRAHEAAIYGTRGGPWLPGDYGVSTRKGNKIYLFVQQDWRAETVRLPVLPASVKSAKLLGGGSLNVSQANGKVTLKLPASQRKPMFTIVELTMDADVMRTPVVAAPGLRELSVGKPVVVSSFWAGRPELDARHITDGNRGSMWATAEKERSGSVTVDLGAALSVSSVRWSDYYGRTRSYDIEVETSSGWKRVASGGAIVGEARVSFDAVKTKKVRLNIREANDTPTVAEFTVLGE